MAAVSTDARLTDHRGVALLEGPMQRKGPTHTASAGSQQQGPPQ